MNKLLLPKFSAQRSTILFSGILFWGVLFGLSCGAAENGIKKPRELNGIIRSEQPIGTGTLSFLFLDVYDAALWSDSQKINEDGPYALSVNYRMSFTKDELADRSVKELSRMYSFDAEERRKLAEEFRRVFPSVSSGDVLTALYRNADTVFFLNGERVSQVGEPVLAKRLFEIWLSPKTSEPALRLKLLGSQRE